MRSVLFVKLSHFGESYSINSSSSFSNDLFKTLSSKSLSSHLNLFWKTGRMDETNKSCWLSSLCDQFKMCRAADLLMSWWLIMEATVWRRMYWAVTPHCVGETLMKALWQWVFTHHDITCTEKQTGKHLNVFLFQLLFCSTVWLLWGSPSCSCMRGSGFSQGSAWLCTLQ